MLIISLDSGINEGLVTFLLVTPHAFEHWTLVEFELNLFGSR